MKLGDTSEFLQQAKEALQQRRPGDAEALLRQALNLAGDDYDAFQLLGVACIHQSKLDDGIAALKRAANLRPSDARAQFNLGSAYALAQRWNEANGAFQVALQIDPGYQRAREALNESVLKLTEHMMSTAEGGRPKVQCVNHPTVMSADKCRQCGGLICEECIRMDYGTAFCPRCYQEVVEQREGIAQRRGEAMRAAASAEEAQKRGGLRGLFGRKE